MNTHSDNESARTWIALQAAGIGIWEYNTQSKEMLWDDRMYELYQVNSNDFPNPYAAWLERIHPDSRRQVLEQINESIETKNNLVSEFAICFPNGETRYIEAHASIIQNDSGDVVQLVGTSSDITSKKLSESEYLKLSNIAKQTDNIVIVTNLKGETEWVNEAFMELTGYPPEEIVGKKPGDLLQGPGTNPKTIIKIGKALKEGKPCQAEILNYHKSGTPYWVELRITPTYDSAGNLHGFMALEMDIDERKKAEQNFARQQDMLEAMSRQARIGAWEVDMVTGTVYWSSMTRLIHEVNDDFVPNVETGINFYKEGASRDRISHVVSRAIETGEPWSDELQLVTAKGSEIWVQATGQAEFKNGECIRLFGSFQDIQERKENETALTSAIKEAEQAVVTKSQFLASMSHEIRTPMNGVIGMLNLMLNEELNERQIHHAKLAKSSAESLLTVINDILDFSKVEAGKLELESSDFNLPELLSDFTESISHTCAEKGLDIILDASDIEHPMVKGDAGRLRQILTNLVGNAVKFTQNGEILIHAALRSLDNAQYQFTCEVSDTGIGIPTDKLDKLFEAFTQVDASTTRQYGGTGLGLAIVKNLCQLMGGDISASSQTGEGSAFKFNITFLVSDLCTDNTELDINAKTILVDIQNTSQSHALCKQISKWKADAQAINWSDYIKSIGSTSNVPCALIIETDIDKNKVSTLKETIHATPLLQNMKIIIVGKARRSDDLKALTKLGIDACIDKNITPKTLKLALQRSGVSRAHSSDSTVFSGYQRVNDSIGKSAKESEAQNERAAHVLVVEDVLVNQILAEGMLEHLGISCDIANNGIEAINILKNTTRQESYDLILMDCQMPEMDGYEATRLIRQGKAGKRFEDMPIIAVTANAIKGDKDTCLQAGMNDYLSKPLDPDEFETKMTEWLNKKHL